MTYPEFAELLSKGLCLKLRSTGPPDLLMKVLCTFSSWKARRNDLSPGYWHAGG
jgi:hypothetical protein